MTSIRLKAAIAITLIIFIGACKKDSLIKSDDHNQSTINLTETERLLLSRMGFNPDSVKEQGDYYVIEDDILIPKQPIRDDANKGNSNLPKTRQYNTTNVVNNSNDHNINIFVEESLWVNPIWYAGLLEAMRNWNSINSNIKLHLISDSYYTSERIDITIRSDNGTLPLAMQR